MYSNTDTEGTIESVRIGTKPPGELLGILGGSVPPSSSTPDPISDLNKSFYTRFQTWPLRNYVIITQIRRPTGKIS